MKKSILLLSLQCSALCAAPPDGATVLPGGITIQFFANHSLDQNLSHASTVNVASAAQSAAHSAAHSAAESAAQSAAQSSAQLAAQLAAQSAAQSEAAHIASHAPCCRVSEVLQGAHQRVASLDREACLSFAQRHRLKLGCAFVGSAWFALWLTVHRMSSRLSDVHECWSLWHSDLAPVALYAMEQDRFVQDLLAAIQVRYSDLSDMENFKAPIVSFFKSIEDETALLERYALWHWALSKVSCAWMFSFDDTLLKVAKERREKLNFLKLKMSNWLAQLKIERHGVSF